MKKAIKLIGVIAMVAVIGFSMAACGGDDNDGGAPALTGTVSITGTATVGQTLTANTVSLGGSGTISYQWKRGDTSSAAGTNITSATASTYTLVAEDEGKFIKVTVTRAGYSGSVTSSATAAVAANTLPALTGTVTITGTAMVGQTLTADTDELEGSGTISYQWKRGDSSSAAGTNITTATASTYILVAEDEGKFITVTVARLENSGDVTSAATSAIAPLPALTGTVSITGTAKLGQTLTADTSSLGGSGTISYQWKRGTGGSFTPITGATSSTYQLTTPDYNNSIVVVVTRTDNSGNVTSTQTSAVADIMTWTQVSQSVLTDNINRIAFGGISGNARWVAVGGSGSSARVASSTDGVTWSDYANQTNASNSVAYTDNRWIVVGSSGAMFSSTTGAAPWSTVSGVSSIFNNAGAQLTINDVAYGNGCWIVIGSGRIGVSSNFTTWTAPNTQPLMTTTDVCYNSGEFMVVGGKNTAKAYTGIESVDTWSSGDVSSIFTGSDAIQTVAYGNLRWIIAGDRGKMASSTNGTSWTVIPGTPFGTGRILAIAYGNGKWIAVGSESTNALGVTSGSRIAVSTDGTNWIFVANTAFGSNEIKSCAYGNNRWVAVGDGGRIAYADDN